MIGDIKGLILEVLYEAEDLSQKLRSQPPEVRSCEKCSFDESYIAFLDKQIQLSPRGPEWTERLKRRRKGLAPFCGVQLVSGHVRIGTSGITVHIHPKTRRVVYWEEYQNEYGTADPDAAPDRGGR